MSASFIASVALRALLIVACAAGVRNALFKKKDGYMTAGGVWYYTIQSNLWVMLMTAIYLALSLLGADMHSRALELARFAVLVGITLTFLIFWLVLAPKLEKEYLLSVNNLLVHTLVPLMYIADFFLFGRMAPPRMPGVLCAMAMPLYYFVLSIAHAAANPNLSFYNESRYPYFFLDIDRFGWFRVKNGLGVFWWTLIFLVLTLGLGFLYDALLGLLG